MRASSKTQHDKQTNGSSSHHSYDDNDDGDYLDERIESLLDLLVTMSSDSIDNTALENDMHVFASLNIADLTEEPQPYDRHFERIVAVLETCRSVDDAASFEKPSSAPQRQRRRKSMTNSPRRGSDYIPSSMSSPPRRYSTGSTRPQPQPPQKQQLSAPPKLQDQFDKEEQDFNSNAYPKIGPGYSDAISVTSDLTTPTFLSGDIPHIPDNLGRGLTKFPSYYRLQRQSSASNRGGGGAAAQRRYEHQARLGGGGGDYSIPESRQYKSKKKAAYPSLSTSPNLYPSVFPNEEEDDDMLLPYSPRRQATTSLLNKKNRRQKQLQQQSVLSSSHTKQSRALNSGRMRKLNGVGDVNGRKSKDVNVDGVLNTIGKDIDYIFQQLAVLEEEEEEATALEQHDDVSETNLGATAKLKYTLGSVGRTLKEQQKEDSALLTKQKDRLSWSPLETTNTTSSNSKSPSSSVTPKSDPLLIDEDGFIIFENDSNDEEDDGLFANVGVATNSHFWNSNQSERGTRSSNLLNSNDDVDFRKNQSERTPRKLSRSGSNNIRSGSNSRSSRRNSQERSGSNSRSSRRNSQEQHRSGSRSRRSSQERERSQERRSGSNSRHTRRSSQERRSGSDSRHTRRSSQERRSGSNSRTSRRSNSNSRYSNSQERSLSRSSGSGRRVDFVDNDSSSSSTERINGVEAATRERIDLLRQLVSNKKGNSSNDAISNKLDFVEEETMKQIARLRDRMGDNRSSSQEEIVR